MKHVSALICVLIFCGLKTYAQLTYNELAVPYDSAWSYKNLKLIPVKFKSPDNGVINSNAGFINFSDALQTGKISLHELSRGGGPDINTLFIKNHSKKNIIINSGEMIAGGKQDRAAAVTTIIPPEEDYYLPVYCIEKGRWNGKAKAFSYAGNVDASLKKQIDVAKKQNDVWKEIDSQYQKNTAVSDTWPYLKLYNDSSDVDTSYMNYFMERLKNSDSSFAGFVAITGNHIINCELFVTPELCYLSYKGLLNSYIRAVANKQDRPSVDNKQVHKFLDLFLKSATQQKRYVGAHGRVDNYDTKLIHLVAYPE